MTTISIEVDNEVARSFLQASLDEKRQFQRLLNLRSKEIDGKSQQTISGNYG